MKKTFRFIYILVALSMIFISCGSKATTDSETDEETGLEKDVSGFSSWGNGAFYDSTTHVFSTTSYNAMVGLNVENDDLSEYNCVQIKYTADNYGFFFGLSHRINGTLDQVDYFCPANLHEFIIPLDMTKIDNLADLYLRSIWNQEKSFVKIEGIKFLKRDNPGPSKAYNPSASLLPADNGTAVALDDSLSAWDFLPKMGAGIQYAAFCDGAFYGNDFGADSTYAMGYPVENQELYNQIKAKGFDTVRFQVTGYFHAIDSNNTLDPAYLAKVKKNVDFAINAGLYVIICEGVSYYYDAATNSFRNDWIENHLKCKGYSVNENCESFSKQYLSDFWRQIATIFNNSYNEHLVFELMNEPIDTTPHTNIYGSATSHSFHPNLACEKCKANTKVLNRLNKAALDAIRATGGNNAKRYIMIPTAGQDPWSSNNPDFEMPDDSKYNSLNKLIASIHNYPMGNLPDSNGVTGDIEKYFSSGIKQEKIVKPFEDLDAKFFSKNIPVAITEIGCSRRTPLNERLECMTCLMEEATKTGRSTMVSIHDNNSFSEVDIYGNVTDYFGYFNKETFEWYDSSYIDLIINAAKGNLTSFTNPDKPASICGKELLPNALLDLKHWEAFLRMPAKTFAKQVPGTFKIKIGYTKKVEYNTEIKISYPDKNWEGQPLFNLSTPITSEPASVASIIQGANGDMLVTVSGAANSTGTIYITIDEEKSALIQAYGMDVQGGDIILNSLMIVE